MNYLEGVSYIPDEFIERETESFYKSLGIDGLCPETFCSITAGANLFVDSYFKTETVVSISDSASINPGKGVS